MDKGKLLLQLMASKNDFACLKDEMEKLKFKHEEVQDANTRTITERDELIKKVESLEERETSVNNSKARLMSEMTELNSQNARFRKELQETDDTLRDLVTEYEKKELYCRSYHLSKNDFMMLEAEKKGLLNQVQHLKNSKESVMAELDELKLLNTKMEEVHKSHKETAEAEISHLRNLIMNESKELEELKSLNRKVEKEKIDLMTEKNALLDQLQETNRSLTQQQKVTEELQAEVKELKDSGMMARLRRTIVQFQHRFTRRRQNR